MKKSLFTIKSIAACAIYTGTSALFIAISLPALAHVTLEYQVANAESYYKATLRVGHGCEGSPVKQIIAVIPAGVQGAKPMPKAGWNLDITREKLAEPYDNHGKKITEDVTRITWTAKTKDDYLQDAQYDEFVLRAKLPSKSGMVYWPVSQVCEQGRTDWTQIPSADQKLSDLKTPAAALEILPVAGSGEHKH